MKTSASLHDTQFVLFGAGGDLSWRLIVPALFDLFLNGRLPGRFMLLGVGRADIDAGELAKHFLEGVIQHSRSGAPSDEAWQRFAGMIRYVRSDISDPASFTRLGEMLASCDQDWNGKADKVYYLATPPSLFEPVVCGLGGAGLAQDREHVRIVVEKPLGRDLESFREINKVLCNFFDERQIFRIDHFLGKETVQNILAMRFANPIFEPVWNRRYVDHVTITVSETLGVEKRGGYYEHAGALRDMVQNHLMQLLCLVAMEPPVAYEADDIRDRKVDVLHALRPITGDDVPDCAARGQYGEGWIQGTHMPGYRDEPDVSSRFQYRNLCRCQTLCGQLALAGCAVLSAYRQTPVRSRLGNIHTLPRCPPPGFSRVRRTEHPAGTPGDPDSAGTRHRLQVHGQGARFRISVAARRHALQLQGGIPGRCARSLRDLCCGM